MSSKPRTVDGYSLEQTQLVRSTCLYIATVLGDLKDEIVIAGGLVPTLLIDSDGLPDGEPDHVGTQDLDLGLELALLDGKRYEAVTQRLRDAGFEPDKNDEDNVTRQRWRSTQVDITVDFLIPPSREGDKGGKLRDIQPDFAALITPGLDLAFQDSELVLLEGETIDDDGTARRRVRVCGPGAFVVLKALAFRDRGERKDAYDLYYLLRNYPGGVEGIVARLGPLLDHPKAHEALVIMHEDFGEAHNIGPARVAKFITRGRDADIEASVSAYVHELLRAVELAQQVDG